MNFWQGRILCPIWDKHHAILPSPISLCLKEGGEEEKKNMVEDDLGTNGRTIPIEMVSQGRLIHPRYKSKSRLECLEIIIPTKQGFGTGVAEDSTLND